MASGAETAEETAKFMAEQGEKVGVLTVRMYRPFAVENFLNALPKTVKSIAVLDRTKEPGADGEPLYKDVAAAVLESCKNGTAPFQLASLLLLADALAFHQKNSHPVWSKVSLMS